MPRPHKGEYPRRRTRQIAKATRTKVGRTLRAALEKGHGSGGVARPPVPNGPGPDFDTAALAFPGRPDHRVLVATGTLLATAFVIGQLLADDTVVLRGIEVELVWPHEPR